MSASREFDRHALVLLRRPSEATDLPEAELDRLQEEHLEHLRALRGHGLLVAGPFRDQEDESLRGLCLFARSRNDAWALMARDPSVRAGRLRSDVMTWLTEKGALRLAASASS